MCTQSVFSSPPSRLSPVNKKCLQDYFLEIHSNLIPRKTPKLDPVIPKKKKKPRPISWIPHRYIDLKETVDSKPRGRKQKYISLRYKTQPTKKIVNLELALDNPVAMPRNIPVFVPKQERRLSAPPVHIPPEFVPKRKIPKSSNHSGLLNGWES